MVVYMSLILYNVPDISRKVQFRIILPNERNKPIRCHGESSANMSDNSGFGWTNFATRTEFINSLTGGSLRIEVHMKLDESLLPSFVPENPSSCKVIQNMFNDQESSDVTIEVGKQAAKSNARKKAKTPSITLYAHRNILQQCASVLYDMCASGEKEHSTTIQITDVSPEIFHHLLHYIYGGKVSDDDMKANAKEIIDAADKYGVSNLKLEAEASLVHSTTFSMENAMDHLLYAEAKNCALLKETVLDFMVENKVEVLQKLSFKDAPGTLINDVFAAVARGEKKSGNDASNDDQLCTMRISDLRRKVHEKGLDVDGSREMLIAALEESSE